MANQIYVFYEKTNPFAGWIRFHGVVDPAQTPDGSTLAERLTVLKTKYPDSDYFMFPLGTPVDPEAQKFDAGTSALVALDPADITPEAQAALDDAQKEQDFLSNLPSWNQVQTVVNNIGSMADAKAFLLKLTRVVYWLAKDSKD